VIHTTSDTSCVVCGGRYNNTARPRYVLDLVGHVVGTAHTSCHERSRWMREGGYTPLIGRFSKSEREAQLDFYIHVVLDFIAESNWPATYLALAANEGERAEALAWWQTGPMQATADWLVAVQHDYQNLVSAFEAWRETIMKSTDPTDAEIVQFLEARHPSKWLYGIDVSAALTELLRLRNEIRGLVEERDRAESLMDSWRGAMEKSRASVKQ
jgi:hypothetical protein